MSGDVELTGAGTVRVLREHLRAAGLPDNDRNVYELLQRIPARAAVRDARAAELRTLFGPRP